MSEAKRFKYSIHLAHAGVTELDDFMTSASLSRLENGDVRQTVLSKFELRSEFDCECVLYGSSGISKTPEWAEFLDSKFKVGSKLQSSSSSAVMLFKCNDRVMAATFGHGHTMLDESKRENGFGLIVAANWLSDESVKSVEKANLDSVDPRCGTGSRYR